jgi:DNA-binding MarR family transcriptional regulator
MRAPLLTHPRTIDDLFLYRISRLLVTGGAQVIRLCEGTFGITRREWRILALLAQGDGLMSSELAGRAQLDRARTSRAVTALAAKQLVSRNPRPGDRRSVMLSLTPAGRALFDALFPQVAAINRSLLGALDDAELERLDTALATLQARADTLVQAQARLGGARGDGRGGGRVRRR